MCSMMTPPTASAYRGDRVRQAGADRRGQAARSLLVDVPPTARSLCLEITETAAISDLEETTRRLSAMRGRGISLALDDFGTGHSSLTMLRRLPVDTVKIGKSFVDKITDDAEDAALVRLIIDAAHIKGMSVCAEGVETDQQVAQLAALGCDLIQGWLVAHPQPGSAALTQWLHRRSSHTDPGAAPAA